VSENLHVASAAASGRICRAVHGVASSLVKSLSLLLHEDQLRKWRMTLHSIIIDFQPSNGDEDVAE